MNPNPHEIGVGATDDLSLRVSVAALVSVLFDDPEDGQRMLALERTATLRVMDGPVITVRAKPFGGAVRLTRPQALQERIGDFHYDSERSRRERDFRLQIHPASWENVKEVCRECLKLSENGMLDSSPERELAEEFEDILSVRIDRGRYQVSPRGMIVEDLPRPTDSVRAAGTPTVRIFYVYEVWMKAPQIITMILANSKQYSDEDLWRIAWEDARQGGRGRANACLALGLDDLKSVYRSISMDRRSRPIRVGKHQLDGNVPAILEDVDQPKYERYG